VPGVDALQRSDIPEEQIWLDKQKSARTRRAYRLDVQHLMRTLSITTRAEVRQADHKGVIAWERFMRETERAAASTIHEFRITKGEPKLFVSANDAGNAVTRAF
jgi:Phage integrase, N-terminal SAM-like domain